MSFFVSLAFLSIGFYVLYWLWRQDKLVRLSQAWPQAVGKVLVSEIIEARPQQDEHPNLSFVYQYEVNGVSFTSSKINHYELETKFTEVEMRNFVHRYPAQAQISVYYDAEHPHDSVLLVEDMRGRKNAKALAILCLSFGVLMAWMSWS